MKVLVACEYSGVVRDAFLRRGHHAVSCDLLPTESPGPHYQGNVLDILYDGWDAMIAHPDCTYLTCSAEWAYGDGPYHQRVKPDTLVGAARRAARRDALAFVEKLASAPIDRISLENPAIGAINRNLDLIKYGFSTNFPTQVIHPHQYGHDASKATGLALKNLPPLKPTQAINPRMVCGCGNTFFDSCDKYGCSICHGKYPAKPRWGNQTDSGQNRLSPSSTRWKDRAKTYSGWADAMADQWGGLCTD